MEKRPVDFCLLIPCYNNFDGLIRSLQSVSYYAGRLMIVVVDDGSDVPLTAASIEAEMDIDFPVIVIRNEQNRGITSALNKGLEWIEMNAATEYVARLDCGDVCAPDRFYRQIGFLAVHPEIGLLGSWCIFEERKSGFHYYYKTPTSHELILREMHFRNLFIHPTVVFKIGLARQEGLYPPGFPHAEDYALFWRLLQRSRGCIIGEYLVTCEISGQGLSLKNRRAQLTSRSRIIRTYGTDTLLKIVGMLRITGLRLIPKRLALHLKKGKGQ